MMQRRGFTLLEMAVTLAILVIVLAIALPSLIQMSIAGNETSIIQAMRSVVQACESFRMRDAQGDIRGRYPVSLAALAGAIPPYLDRRFSALALGRPWRGYVGQYTPAPERTIPVGNITYRVRDAYTLTADPVRRGLTGQRSFYVDQTGVVRFNTQGPATANDPALEEAR